MKHAFGTSPTCTATVLATQSEAEVDVETDTIVANSTAKLRLKNHFGDNPKGKGGCRRLGDQPQCGTHQNNRWS